MRKYAEKKDYILYHSDMNKIEEDIKENSIDSIITDPPYELNFMGKGWDNSGVAFSADTWKKCFDVLKPGGYLLAFGGSRTYHRICCAIEDAGFEIRDCIMWLYGSGFPKSMNIGLAIDKKNGVESIVVGEGKSGTSSRAFQSEENTTAGKYKIKEAQNKWQGWGTCLKPAYEPIIVARKPFKGSLVDNVIENGVGGLNIDECRVGELGGVKKIDIEPNSGSKNSGFGCNGKLEDLNMGRFPANVILTYDENDFEEVCGGFPDTKGGNRHNTAIRRSDKTSFGFEKNTRNEFNDEGSASRYFYCAKASKKDRDEGLEEFNNLKVNDGRQTPIDNPFQRGETPRKNIHPTVKPTQLMQYLIRLVTPKGGTVMDCFMGSGSTGKAVMFENRERNAGYKFIGIEMTDEYLPIAESRIEYALNKYEDNKEEKRNGEEREKKEELTIFDFIEEK